MCHLILLLKEFLKTFQTSVQSHREEGFSFRFPDRKGNHTGARKPSQNSMAKNSRDREGPHTAAFWPWAPTALQHNSKSGDLSYLSCDLLNCYSAQLSFSYQV